MKQVDLMPQLYAVLECLYESYWVSTRNMIRVDIEGTHTTFPNPSHAWVRSEQIRIYIEAMFKGQPIDTELLVDKVLKDGYIDISRSDDGTNINYKINNSGKEILFSGAYHRSIPSGRTGTWANRLKGTLTNAGLLTALGSTLSAIIAGTFWVGSHYGVPDRTVNAEMDVKRLRVDSANLATRLSGCLTSQTATKR